MIVGRGRGQQLYRDGAAWWKPKRILCAIIVGPRRGARVVESGCRVSNALHAAKRRKQKQDLAMLIFALLSRGRSSCVSTWREEAGRWMEGAEVGECGVRGCMVLGTYDTGGH